jgi:hypothetical protein
MTEVPSKLGHLKMLATIAEHNRRASASKLDLVKGDLSILGIALSILYQAGTRHRKCFGGPHVLERLSGRAYNLACSSYILVCRGFYDEALNLVRSMGEIANLIALSVVDKDSLGKWLEADTKTRLREFSPLKIRTLLEKHDPSLMYATQDWYSTFCETYTHVTPGTKPNMHNETDQSFVGGVVQEKGLRHAAGELTSVTAHIAMLVAKYVDFDDLFDELREEIRGAGAERAAN